MDAETAADPILAYRALLEAGQIRPDPSQALATEKLQGLHEDLCAYTPQMGKKGWMKRLSLGRNKVLPPQGLYLWGGVGRGKTFLMDLFHDSIPFEEKRRVHFHRFMLELHDHLHQLRFQSDPMAAVVDRLVGDCRVLSLDEFFVSDIGDAMMLSGVLQELFVRGTVLVTTSNIAPDGLYRRGLQRQRFLPAIALIH